MLSLEQDFAKDREAILAKLRQQDEAISAERKRQLEMARLRRERKLIANEDKIRSAVIIFNQAKKRDELLAERYHKNCCYMFPSHPLEFSDSTHIEVCDIILFSQICCKYHIILTL